jgi:hypothetical protein
MVLGHSTHISSYFHSLLHSSTLYVILNNWSHDLQTWCDLLNTMISQAPPTPDGLADASPLYHRSNTSSTPCSRALFQSPPPQSSYPPPYHYPPYPYPSPPVGSSSGDNAPPPYSYPPLPPYGYTPYPYYPPSISGSLDGNAPPPYSYHPPPAYPYPPPQPVHSRGGDNSGGGDNTSHTTQAPSMMKKRNE